MMEDEKGLKDRIRVECYSGYRAEERPLAFHLAGERRIVDRVIDTWVGEDHLYFKLLADDRKVYLIRYDRWNDFWTLERIMDRVGKD